METNDGEQMKGLGDKPETNHDQTKNGNGQQIEEDLRWEGTEPEGEDISRKNWGQQDAVWGKTWKNDQVKMSWVSPWQCTRKYNV